MRKKGSREVGVCSAAGVSQKSVNHLAACRTSSVDDPSGTVPDSHSFGSRFIHL